MFIQWESLGFKDNPFNTDPIIRSTIELDTDHEKAITVGMNVLRERNVLMIIEGARGVGTTSFGNFLRFTAQRKDYFTPSNGIRVGAGWSLETLLAVIIANVVREIELSQTRLVKNKKFQKYLFNELRDYIQTPNVSWLFVGDIGLRKFIVPTQTQKTTLNGFRKEND